MARYCVIGSLNMDLFATCDRFPERGENVFGKDFKTSPGGKGGNQAVALAFLEQEVYMIGCLGDDMYGKRYMTHLDNAGVETSGIEMIEGISSGVALIELEINGAYRVIVMPGSNAEVTVNYVKSQQSILDYCDYVMLQGEIPYETIFYSARKAFEKGKITIFDPDPVEQYPDELYQYISILTPNKRELFKLTGIYPNDDHAIFTAAQSLRDRGVGEVILTCGAEGAYYIGEQGFFQIDTIRDTYVVDTTATGDAFNSGLVYALGDGYSIGNAIRFANSVASMSVERLGAHTAMPILSEAQDRYLSSVLRKRVIHLDQ